jgi:transposase InsO family protein
MDLLQITPLSQGSFQYVLVLINDFSRFNCIYLLKNKKEAEVNIMSYLNEINNHIGVTPAILHTNQGGEFGSVVFRNFLSQRGISLEQGPANLPQTNGLAKRFNQTLSVKVQCMLAQCLVPINYWDKAIKFSSNLVNMLPLSALNGKSPTLVLVDAKSTIEQVRHVQTLLPFGLKVYVHTQSPSSKVLLPSKPFFFLGYEPRSDALRFLDPISC